MQGELSWLCSSGAAGVARRRCWSRCARARTFVARAGAGVCRCPAHVLGVGSMLRLLNMLITHLCWGACVAPALVRRRRCVAAPLWLPACAGTQCASTWIHCRLPQLRRVISAQPPWGAAGPVCKHFDLLQAATAAQKWYLALPRQGDGVGASWSILCVAEHGWPERMMPFGQTGCAMTGLRVWAVISATLLLLGWLYASLAVLGFHSQGIHEGGRGAP